MADYKERYEQIVKSVKELVDSNPHDEGIMCWVNENVPEALGTADERIGRFLIDFLGECRWTEKESQGWPSKEDCISWIRKMVEHRHFIDTDEVDDNTLPKGEDYGIDGLWHAQRILEMTLGHVDGYQSDDGILDHKCAISAVKEMYNFK